MVRLGSPLLGIRIIRPSFQRCIPFETLLNFGRTEIYCLHLTRRSLGSTSGLGPTIVLSSLISNSTNEPFRTEESKRGRSAEVKGCKNKGSHIIVVFEMDKA